ncbi:MAG: hypothetical protein GY940_16465, partial [bacterium]|nr:hypothetical protein [bacterium]
ADVLWEVAGFRSFRSQNGVEIAISERWPLKLPNKPTGLLCRADIPGYGINVANLDREMLDKTKSSNSSYINDRWELSGTFNLTGSPYGTNPAVTLFQPESGQMIGNLERVNFHNVLVDWGDGSPAEEISARPTAGNLFDYDKSLEMDMLGMIHRYQQAGTYMVRVFQVPEQQARTIFFLDKMAKLLDQEKGNLSPFRHLVNLQKIPAKP